MGLRNVLPPPSKIPISSSTSIIINYTTARAPGQHPHRLARHLPDARHGHTSMLLHPKISPQSESRPNDLVKMSVWCQNHQNIPPRIGPSVLLFQVIRIFCYFATSPQPYMTHTIKKYFPPLGPGPRHASFRPPINTKLQKRRTIPSKKYQEIHRTRAGQNPPTPS